MIQKSKERRAKKSELLLIIHSFIGFGIEAFSASVTVTKCEKEYDFPGFEPSWRWTGRQLVHEGGTDDASVC